MLVDIPKLLFMPTAAITTKLIHYWSNLQEVSTVMDYLLRHDYRVDSSTPVPLEEDHQVVVPDTSLPLSDQQMAFLENHCNPLQENDKSGENIYLCT